MPRGRPASEPARRRKRPNGNGGKIVLHISETGEEQRVFDFQLLPVGDEMQAALADVWRRLTGLTGPWRSIASSKQGWQALQRFANWTERDAPIRRQSDITPALLAKWTLTRPRNSTGRRDKMIVARILRECDGLSAEALQSLCFRSTREKTQTRAYSVDQARQIGADARRVFAQAERRIRMTLSKLDAEWLSDSGAEADPTEGRTLDSSEHSAQLPGSLRGIRIRMRSIAESTRAEEWKSLFLTGLEARSIQVLLCDEFGWNLSSIQRLGIPETTADEGVSLYHLRLEKRRRKSGRRFDTASLIDDGPQSRGRIITRILEATEPAREVLELQGGSRNDLVIWRSRKAIASDDEGVMRSGMVTDGGTWNRAFGYWVNFKRLRRTFNVLRGGGPNQNTARTHHEQYQSIEPVFQREMAPVIAAGANAALLPATLIRARVAEEDAPGDETATATCLDFEHSPFSEPELACRATFLLCFACPNAVIMPRHVPRATFLLDSLTALRTALPPMIWRRDWENHWARLTSLKDQFFSGDSWEAYRSLVTNRDRSIVEKLLQGRLAA